MLHAMLTILLWTAGIVLALLLLLLILPVWLHISLKYDQWELRLQVAGFSVRLYPAREKKPKKAKQAKQKVKKKQAPAAPKPKKGLPEWVTPSTVIKLVQLAGGLMRRVLRVLKVRGVRLVLPVNGQDAAETALCYGRTNAAVYSGLALLQNAVNLSVESVEIVPDFGADHKFRRSFYCKVGSCPIIMISVGVWAIYTLFKSGVLGRRQGGKKNERQSPAGTNGCSAAAHS
ncbi:MAG: DUF2953 domain-containing protein [Pygmaiobacter massiliensis]|nr:DUF2953 domain-containing protein [Pygmaiobacter massiliensis]